MILGDVCTRACAYCAVAHGRPPTLDLAEPGRVADAVQAMDLSYVVITSVDRDDLKDGGASIFADTIRQIRARTERCRIEVLIPDFQGHEAPLQAVLDAGPDVLNHNTETVPRLYRMARSGGRYTRTLELLDRSRRYAPQIPTKSGVMVGLGEEKDELVQVFRDLREVGCSILTVGQYLRPSADHTPMTRYYHPDEFRELKQIALDLGFVHVESGPLVRSSYHAHEQTEAYERRAGVERGAVGGRLWAVGGRADRPIACRARLGRPSGAAACEAGPRVLRSPHDDQGSRARRAARCGRTDRPARRVLNWSCCPWIRGTGSTMPTAPLYTRPLRNRRQTSRPAGSWTPPTFSNGCGRLDPPPRSVHRNRDQPR